ncbi:hypothetical protein GTP44_20485 [Duganella sp. FT50W]|uniref:Uncharacterized protein n=1 Tax=Duganella lactea TaxID=2692173 RepID=A0A6L8MR45_9BURK|nr:hypothetical protein [Duganella lactea]MYM84318.1 hypothetical protein [Duganella lactea]
MRALFKTVRWKEKFLPCGPNDFTAENWRAVARDAQVKVASDAGIDVSTIGSINDFWRSMN